MRALAWLLALGLFACTGENVDEDFVSTHGALLARVSCSKGVYAAPGSGGTFIYDALMFLDGSVMSWVNLNHGGQAFYERSDSDRLKARVDVTSYNADCGGPAFIQIDSGDLTKTICTGNPGTYQVDFSMDIDTDCTGFNKHLFD